ncbi:putative SERF-like protein isoform X3 [Diabrotica virgifera virgifera]|uniref:SERF-like protein isoform X3 n=1 Tax=Diabrotica virgifera virgifera TaxID=50390 RepID=A0A6P7GHQ0_DIAVI|nr:putative SERF-like protein isoform X3 [Diabrotica virgifera virgifera]XP_028149372.1 putative SERF-like protein isoform X3 [Diabrotica virgifera virgifera]XP_050519543.1 putative SERF-like protein isoform X3 [Diabrotica virgifera virgifera]
MTRGNQRELARAKNQKKQQEQAKNKRSDGLTLEQRKFRDAELMREKQKKKQDDESQGSGQACK